MRAVIFLAAIALTVAPHTVAEADESERPMVMYSVQVAEYRMTGKIDATKSDAELIAMLTKSNPSSITSVETFRFNALSDTQASVQIGRLEDVVTGVSSSRGVVTKRTETIETGTHIRFQGRPQGDKIVLEIDYDSSRLLKSEDEDRRGPISQIELQTTQLVAPGEPSLVGTKSAETSILVLMTVRL